MAAPDLSHEAKIESNQSHDHTAPKASFLDIPDALNPDPGTEDLFEVERNPFAFSPGQLSKLLKPKSLNAFYALGGLNGLERGLRTDRTTGLSMDHSQAPSSKAHSFSSGSIDYTVKGVVGEWPVDALPDTGAKNNFISPRLAKRLGLEPLTNTKSSIQLPNGQKVKSPGKVEVPFSFSGESEEHLLDCCILPKATRDLILCQSFLEVTSTLTTFARRITRSLRAITTRLQLNLLGNDRRCLWGRLDDLPASALADTGCDVMLISTQFAKKHSLKIDRSMEHRRTIQYADGSLDTTAGLVRDVAWQFGNTKERVKCDFYVLDNLTVDAILSNHFLFELDVFARFGNYMVDVGPITDFHLSDLYNIRLISKYSRELEALESSSINDMNSPNAFSPEAVKAERVRRDQISDEIDKLPISEQDQARIDERNRQEIWDGRRRPSNPSRRQALNACDACRKRKTKCDESKPSCARCTRLGLDCSYVETVAAKKNLSVTELTGTLKRMDEKLDILTAFVQQNDGHHRTPREQALCDHAGLASSPSTSQVAAFSPLNLGGTGHLHTASTPFLDTGRILEELSLSQRHSTAPQHLLTWPCSPLQMSEPELQYPMDFEIKRPRLSQSTAPPHCLAGEASPGGNSWLSRLSLSHVSLLTQSYFQHFHPSCLILDESNFYSQVLSNAVQTNFTQNYNTCTVLLVCSLGSIAAYYSGHEEWSSGHEHDVGIGFFNLANEMFRDLEGADWESIQCLLLMGLFYSAKLRVYDAWQVNHRACCTVSILVPLQRMLEAQHCQLFWIAYLQESQILAEFDFPASGLGKLASSMPLPVVPAAGTDPRHAQYQFFFLALISMRKLLNRILFHLYSRTQSDDNMSHDSPHTDKSAAFLSVSPTVIYELDRQLEEWRSCLPQGLEFGTLSEAQLSEISLEQHHRSIDEKLRSHLISRYFAAKSIIHRPYIYKALHHDPTTPLSEIDSRGARIAVGCALLVIANSGMLHEPLVLLLHPINSCRSLFALEVQISLVLRDNSCQFALPQQWRIAEEARKAMSASIAEMSPTAVRDGELLQLLAQ
ncbi:hypothetical protein FSARC_1700 [Fusarium sarcochroum]|uniref:Zn(2)-C6 fungal-type domain-containing protein n=1 Tax=Fusarium sarcochroum TaxID=1208366 RepID=A0A8H4U8F4_9HYPO|nr:hypothetical protein FSARC_1700 [Fusarium sarcochroum]